MKVHTCAIPSFSLKVLQRMNDEDVKYFVDHDYEGTYYGKYVQIVHDICIDLGYCVPDNDEVPFKMECW